MANDKEIIKKLFEVVAKQQRVITKLAQATPFAGQGEPPAQNLPDPNRPNLRPADTVLKALESSSPATRAAIAQLEAHGNEMKLRWQPGKGTDADFQAVLNAVQKSAPGYSLKEVV